MKLELAVANAGPKQRNLKHRARDSSVMTKKWGPNLPEKNTPPWPMFVPAELRFCLLVNVYKYIFALLLSGRKHLERRCTEGQTHPTASIHAPRDVRSGELFGSGRLVIQKLPRDSDWDWTLRLTETCIDNVAFDYYEGIRCERVDIKECLLPFLDPPKSPGSHLDTGLGFTQAHRSHGRFSAAGTRLCPRGR